MRTLLTLVVILAVAITLSSCSFKANLGNVPDEKPATTTDSTSASGDKAATETTGTSKSGAKVESLEAGDARDEESRDITNSTTSFAPDTKAIYVNAGISGLTKGAKITGTLFAVDVITASGAKVRDVEVASADVEAPGEKSTANFNFSPPDKGWPTGTYRVDVAVDGEKVDSLDLTIAKAE